VRIDQVEVVRPARTRAGDPRVALVHQDYRLVPFLTVRENLELAMELRSLPPDGNSVAPALAQVGLAGFQDRSPITLSGGEQQRVAIARALVTRATVLLADEPTGALDARNSAAVAEIFGRLGRLPGMTVLVATHDRDVACAFPSVGHLKDGHLTVEPTTHVTT
jgi:putative ABC transport system ATP-binding protein